MSVAAIDIGSNTVRLLVASDEGVEVTRDIAITGLGRGVEQTGVLAAASVDATLEAMRAFRSRMDELGVTRLEAVATSASRDAENGLLVMERIAEILGATPRIIEGSEEAALAFAGAVGAADPTTVSLVIDIGGGSTEFAFGTISAERVRSVDVGSVRLTDRFVQKRPVAGAIVDEVRAACAAAFADVPTEPVDAAYGVAGTWTSLSAIAMHLDVYDRSVVHGSGLSRERVGEVVEELASLTVDQTAAIPSLQPDRAPVIFAGAVIAEQALVHAGLGDITVSEHDMLDGIVRRLVQG